MLILLRELYYQNCSGFETVSKIPQWWLISTSLLWILSIIYEYSRGYSCDPWKSVIYNIYKKKQQSQYKDTSVSPFLMSEYCKNNSLLLLLIGSPVFHKNRTPQFPLLLFESSSLDGAQDTTLWSKRQPFFMYHFILPW